MTTKTKRTRKVDPEIESRVYDFKQAIKAVVERLNPKTLGPCVFCEWPITKCYCSRHGFVCALCLKRTDTLMNRLWEDEEPACAI